MTRSTSLPFRWILYNSRKRTAARSALSCKDRRNVMVRVSFLLLVILVLASPRHPAAFASGDDEKIIDIWEREIGKDKDLLEETWVIKKTKDKWSVSGTIFNNG